MSYEENLKLVGLSNGEACVYELLIQNRAMQAGDIARRALISSRPLAYKILEDLVTLGLVEKIEKPGKVALFAATHPLHLKEMIEKKKEATANAAVAVEGVLGKLISDFNLVSGKPGVRFFEGKSGMKAVLEDSLAASGEIYSYADIEAITKYIPKENEENVKQREKFGIKKKAILLDTPFARKFLSDYHRGVTDVRLIALPGAVPFQTVMQIYDNKVSYLTLGGDNMIGAVIEDPHIFTMHKYLFEYLWNITPPFEVPPQEKAGVTRGPQFEEL